LKEFIFFTVNDFSKDSGGTIRMYGIINALAKLGCDVVLISNAVGHENFHSSVRHVPLDFCFSKKKKRVFQFFLALLSNGIMRILFRRYLKHFAFLESIVRSHPVVCFEHLDNSLGSFFKENGLFGDFIYDTHGIAPLEFKYKIAYSVSEQLWNHINYILSLNLENKVMRNASGFIFVSEAMHDYFASQYDFLKKRDVYIVRDGVNPMLCEQSIDKEELHRLRNRFHLAPGEQVVFFAGNFKDLGGVTDLVEAFAKLSRYGGRARPKLLLVGVGERFEATKSLVRQHGLEDQVIFAGRTPYALLRTYQELASVIVCPDRQHPYSELVPHVKYFDSLASGKVVINGAFAAVKEINKCERFSIDFEPSNIEDLADKIEYALTHLDALQKKSTNNRSIICSRFRYDYFVKGLI
jgi:glycosyltransferase involved in cell wall biosynthesis